jgi:glycosyltransferase involved in cell wall biosynthesis
VRIVLDGRTIADHFPGIGRYAFNLAHALAPELPPGDELLVLHDSRQANTRFNLAELAAQPTLQLVEIEARNFSMAEQWRVPNDLRRLKPSVYHSPYYVMPYWTGCPSVVTIHDLIPFRYPADYSARTRFIIGLTMRLAARTTRQVITASQASARDLVKLLGLAPERLTVVPYAPDPIFQPQSAAAVAEVRERYHLPPAYVLYLGSNKPHKNLPRLVRAYAQVGEMARQVPLVIAGHWDERYQQAKQAAEALAACVTFIGSVRPQDVPALYAGARLFVFPSLYEGYGLPPQEAMACGTSVVCSNAASLVEVVGEAALLFDPLDEASIAASLSRALSDEALRAELAQRGLAQAQNFTWARTARQSLAVYRAAVRAS